MQSYKPIIVSIVVLFYLDSINLRTIKYTSDFVPHIVQINIEIWTSIIATLIAVWGTYYYTKESNKDINNAQQKRFDDEMKVQKENSLRQINNANIDNIYRSLKEYYWINLDIEMKVNLSSEYKNLNSITKFLYSEIYDLNKEIISYLIKLKRNFFYEEELVKIIDNDIEIRKKINSNIERNSTKDENGLPQLKEGIFPLESIDEDIKKIKKEILNYFSYYPEINLNILISNFIDYLHNMQMIYGQGKSKNYVILNEVVRYRFYNITKENIFINQLDSEIISMDAEENFMFYIKENYIYDAIGKIQNDEYKIEDLVTFKLQCVGDGGDYKKYHIIYIDSEVLDLYDDTKLTKWIIKKYEKSNKEYSLEKYDARIRYL